MKVTCPNCSFVGNIKDELIPEAGRNIGCPKCKTKIFVKKDTKVAFTNNEELPKKDRVRPQKIETPRITTVSFQKRNIILIIGISIVLIIVLTCFSLRNFISGARENINPSITENKPINPSKIHKTTDDKKKWLNEGKDFFNAGDYQKALELFNKAVSIDPSDGDSYRWLGDTCSKLHNHEMAIDNYNKAISLSSGYNIDAYYGRGYSRWATSDYYGSLEDLNTVITVEPENVEAYSLRALCYVQLRKPILACEDFRMACNLGDENACESEGLFIDEVKEHIANVRKWCNEEGENSTWCFELEKMRKFFPELVNEM